MTAKEKKLACELAVDDPYYLPGDADPQTFLKKCTTNKDCEFVAQFFAAQEKRRHEATPVGVFWRRGFGNDRPFENFLRSYPFLRNDIPSITQAGIAEVRGRINLLFVLYPDAGLSRLQVYVDSGAGYKKATLADETEFSVESVSWTDGEVSIFFFRSGGKIGPVPPSVEYTLKGETFERTELHEGCYPVTLNPTSPAPRVRHYENVDAPGNDRGSWIRGVSSADCESICIADSECAGYTYNRSRAICIPKNMVVRLMGSSEPAMTGVVEGR